MIDDIVGLIGKPYSKTGQGPEDFNCFGLLHFVETEFFNRPFDMLDIFDMSYCLNTFKTKVKSKEWLRIRKPLNGDAVLLKGGDSPHVGVYLNFDGGGVLHSVTGSGVIFTELSRLNLIGYSKHKFYRSVKWQI